MKTAKKSLSILLALAMVFTLFTCLGLATVSAAAAPTTANSAYHYTTTQGVAIQLKIANVNMEVGKTYTLEFDFNDVNGVTAYGYGRSGFTSTAEAPTKKTFSNGHCAVTLSPDKDPADTVAAADGTTFATEPICYVFRPTGAGDAYIWNVQFKDASGNVMDGTYVYRWQNYGKDTYTFESMSKSDLPFNTGDEEEEEDEDDLPEGVIGDTAYHFTSTAANTIQLKIANPHMVAGKTYTLELDYKDLNGVRAYGYGRVGFSSTAENPTKTYFTGGHYSVTLNPDLENEGDTAAATDGTRFDVEPISYVLRPDNGACDTYLWNVAIKTASGKVLPDTVVFRWQDYGKGKYTFETMTKADMPFCVEGLHNFAKVTDTPSTCTANGVAKFVCSKCGKVKDIADEAGIVAEADAVAYTFTSKNTTNPSVKLGSAYTGNNSSGWKQYENNSVMHIEFDYYLVNGAGMAVQSDAIGCRYDLEDGVHHFEQDIPLKNDTASQVVNLSNKSGWDGHAFDPALANFDYEITLFNIVVTVNGVVPNPGWNLSMDKCYNQGSMNGVATTVAAAIPAVTEELPLSEHVADIEDYDNFTDYSYDEVVRCMFCQEELSRKTIATDLVIGTQTKNGSTRLVMKLCADAETIEAYDSVAFKVVINGVEETINVDCVYDSFYNNNTLVKASDIDCTYVAIYEIGSIADATSVTVQGVINGTGFGAVRTLK